MLAAKSPEMKKPVGVYKELTDEERIRMRYEQREMVLRDIESFKDDAVREENEKWQSIVADKEAILACNDITPTKKEAACVVINEIVMDKETTTAEKRDKIAKLRALLVNGERISHRGD